MVSVLRRFGLNRWAFTVMYLRGMTPWDTGISPPELVEAVEGPNAPPAGRALDLGCGTGTNSLYLARHGWQVTGIDFAAPAIARATAKFQRAGDMPGTARFLRGDVSALGALELGDPFNLLLDLGCFHGLPVERRRDYAAGITRYAASGALYMVYGFLPIDDARARPRGVAPDDMRALFTPAFTVERVVESSDPRARAAAWYWLRRH